MSASEPTSSGPGLRRPANPITSSQVEVVASSATSLLGVVFGLQTVPPLLAQLDLMMTATGLALVTAVFGSLILAGLAAIFRQWRSPIFGLVAFVYLVALIVWPVVVAPIPEGDVPWIFYLCNVATGCAVVAAPTRWIYALAYTIVTPIALGWVRSLPSGGDNSTLTASLDGLYCFLIGIVMLVIVVALRQAAAAVDQAQGYALESYAEAVRNHATESERVRVDALVHDNVLITLLSAARARTQETKALSVKMARSAISHLNDAQTTFPAARGDIGGEELVGRLRIAVAEQRKPLDVHVRLGGSISVPSDVAEAITEAATQAMVNSINHADPLDRQANRSLTITTDPAQAPTVTVVIADDGVGFDPSLVPAERLGLRMSISERLTKVGGGAEVHSAPGAGTTIRLSWPEREGQPRAEASAAPAGLAIVKQGGDWS